MVLPLLLTAQKAGFIGVPNSISQIKDLDEKNAAEWFVNSYGGEYIPIKTLDNIDLTKYNVLWIHVDRWDGVCDVYDEIKENISVLKRYYENGGNLLLTSQAAILLSEMGRIKDAPDIRDASKGAMNFDVWSINPVYGVRCTGDNPIIDRTNDPIFKGLDQIIIKEANGFKFVEYPLLGIGWKEDHNCFWSMSVPDHLILNEDKNKMSYWEKLYNAQALGTWGQVRDYFGATIVRFLPTNNFKGMCLTISLGAYEWHINNKNKPNPYHNNIIKITANALNELNK